MVDPPMHARIYKPSKTAMQSGQANTKAWVLDFEPEVLDGNGQRRPPSEFKALQFASASLADSALACFNSNLFYWFVTAYSDCRHLNKREVNAFPADLPRLANGKIDRRQLASWASSQNASGALQHA